MRKMMKERRGGLGVGIAVAIAAWVSCISIAVAGTEGSKSEGEGKRWAVLVAGSNGFDNYRHQADVYHAYHILRKGGIPDENIVVFMYDDIAHDPLNPTPGFVINRPNGPDVYKGVPKDYTTTHVNKHNLFAVILGNRSALTGGSGKVVDSGPRDTIFIYYADHGSPGLLCMPAGEDDLYADELMDVLKKKHAATAYRKMVLYVEACESGSMFQGLLPPDINIYATTAANASENSYAVYCPLEVNGLSLPTCLGDVFSVSWMEDCDKHDMAKESFEQQYRIVRRRTLFGYPEPYTSHVMQFRDKNISKYPVATFIGSDPHHANRTLNYHIIADSHSSASPTPPKLVNQRDVLLLNLWHKVEKAVGALEKQEAQIELYKELSERKHVDDTIRLIGDLLVGQYKSTMLLSHVHPQDQPLVDDWDCLRTLIRTYERHCGKLSRYGKRYTRAFANMCNAGITVSQLTAASSQACPNKHPPSHTSSLP